MAASSHDRRGGMTHFDIEDRIYSDEPEDDQIIPGEDVKHLFPPWWMFAMAGLRRDVSGLTSNHQQAFPSNVSLPTQSSLV